MKSVSPEELEATHEARLKQREYAANHICTGAGHPQLVKAPIFIQTSPDSRHGAQPVFFALLHFRFASLSHLFFFFMSSFFILGMGHLLSAIVQWKVVAFFLISTEAYGKICLASRRRLWFGIYETCWICEDYWNSWDGLNAYCIMRLRLSFPEARGGTLRFKGIPWVRWASGCGEAALHSFISTVS